MLLAVSALAALPSACVDSAYVVPKVDHASAVVDPTNPGDLAALNIALRFYGYDDPWHATLSRTWLALESEQPLDVKLEPDLVRIPRHVEVNASIVNVGVTNARLVPYCQSTVPMNIHLEVMEEDFVMQLEPVQIPVFCSP